MQLAARYTAILSTGPNHQRGLRLQSHSGEGPLIQLSGIVREMPAGKTDGCRPGIPHFDPVGFVTIGIRYTGIILRKKFRDHYICLEIVIGKQGE